MASPVICIGALLVDELFFCNEDTIAGTSNPAVLKRYTGGVAGNIAHNLALLAVPVQLMTVLGNDPDGNWLEDECHKNNIGTELLSRVNDTTGKYASILNADGSLYVAACTDPCGQYLTPEFLQAKAGHLSAAAMIIADTNISVDSLQWLSFFCAEKNIPLLIEAVSVAKAKKLSAIDLKGIFMITPNEDELNSLCKTDPQNTDEAITELFQRGVKNVWLRKGAGGSTLFNKDEQLELASVTITIKDSTGAGDAALAGWAAAKYYGMNEWQCLKAGHTMALEVLQQAGAIATNITKETFINTINKYYPDEE